MKLAIVQDELIRKAGGEQVAKYFSMAFPEAPIYTLAYNPETTFSYFKSKKVIASKFQVLAKNEHYLKTFFFPFGIWAMKMLDLTSYDVVLISSTHCGKYVKFAPNAIVINYCHTPFRLAWKSDSYSEVLNASFLKKIAYKIVISILQKIDYKASKRVDYYLTNAQEVVHRIQEAYKTSKSIEVINPPTTVDEFYVSDLPKEYFLVVSRLEYYKKTDLVIEAFNELGLPLIIVGKGSKEKELKQLAKENIIFRSNVSETEIKDLYANCKALIFPQLEDYGITPLEAIASGRPVIAYNEGGILETMIPYAGNENECTSIHFQNQTVPDLINAINEFEKLNFNPAFIRNHAQKFGVEKFIKKIQDFVASKVKNETNN